MEFIISFLIFLIISFRLHFEVDICWDQFVFLSPRFSR